MQTVSWGLGKALDRMRDVLSDDMLDRHSSGIEGTLSHKVWVTCAECHHQGETDAELAHDIDCPVGHIRDMFDDIEFPHLKNNQ